VKAARDAREETKDTRTQPFPLAKRAEIYDHYLAEIRRWNPDGSWRSVWREELGRGYALMPFVLPRER